MDALIGRTRLAERAISLGFDDREDVRARLVAARREVLAQALLQHELKDATSESTLRARFEASKDALGRRQIHVRHIIVRFAADADVAVRRRARDRANVFYARISGGEDFDAVAREAGQGEAATEHSADMGIVQEGQVHPSFFEAAAALKKDELSKPFETPYGIHLVQALAPVETVIPSFDEVRGRLAADARREAEMRLMADLESQISVKRFPEAMTPPDAGTAEEGAPSRGERQ
ncbi:peptidylprolyl isomerase [Myxococcus sp. AM009]|uniref:peptidylprolyl isomerase n=1 Tax=Myxococcus sp. AM009 TaxID=2745137 RepID=UPI001595003F|nr:peptidylprolyl isomerase [Myxococcus sp. AM009]NVI98767.1 peptidylprolyl isomerase [Myxococcus sp. AM009]